MYDIVLNSSSEIEVLWPRRRRRMTIRKKVK